MNAPGGRRRILVVGCCGSGKSTFSRELGAATGLPVIHLDQHFWRSGWVEPDRAEWDAELEVLLERPEWIMDGAYVRTLPRRLRAADGVIRLDLPRRLCLARVLRRVVTTWGRTRADLAPGCPEKLDVGFLRWVWHWHRDEEPPMLRALDGAPPGVRTWTLRSPREVSGFLEDARAAATDRGDVGAV